MGADGAPIRFLFPPGRSLSGLRAKLGEVGYALASLVSARYRDLHVDTHDGRLARSGWSLTLRRQEKDSFWHLAGPEGEVYTSPFEGDGNARIYPAAASGFPGRLQDLAGGRSQIPVLRCAVVRTALVAQSSSGSRLSLVLEAFTPSSLTRGKGPRGKARRLLAARHLDGEPDSLLHLGTYLRDWVGLVPEERDLYRLAMADLGIPEPGGPIPEPLRVRREDAVAAAARKVVAQQAIKMRANTRGTLSDLDPEYLHDLRVATRRLRSALRLFLEALGPRRAESLRVELSWIGRLLGTVRDLDVFIANLREQADRLGESAGIARILAGELAERREPAREALVAALSSRRYDSLIRRLDALGASSPPQRLSGLAALPVAEASPLLIRAAQRRVLKLGRSVEPQAGAAVLHRLRILFKRLRYTSEFLKDAFGGELDPYIQAMVRFQDCLGEHQDAVVAMERIKGLANEMVERGILTVESLLDLGALLQVQREIARDRRSHLAELWAKFDCPRTRKLIETLRREKDVGK